MYLFFCLLLIGALQVGGKVADTRKKSIQEDIDAIRKQATVVYSGKVANQIGSIQSIKLPVSQAKILNQAQAFVEKRYSIVNTALDYAEALCGIHFDHMEVITSDESLVACLKTLSRNTNLTIHGTWTIHGNQIGTVCATSSFGMKLPKPGGVISVRDCQYESIHFLGIQLSFRDAVKTATLEKYRQSGKCSAESSNNGDCPSVIEWGDDVPGRHCAPPAKDSLVRVPNTIFQWSPNKDSPKDRTNLKLEISKVRTQMEAKGFIFAPGGIPPYWNTGMIDSIQIQMVCSVTGLKKNNT